MVMTTNFTCQGKAWGLFNGAIGVVIAILYSVTPRRDRDALPLPVVVEFLHYTGPAYTVCMQKVVPFPALSIPTCCSSGCKREQVHLRLAWGGIIDTAKGHAVGDVGHYIHPMICDCAPSRERRIEKKLEMQTTLD